MNSVVKDLTNVTGGTRRHSLLSLVERRCRLRDNLKMGVVQLADADRDFADVEPNRDVSNLCVSRWNRDDETIGEFCVKAVAWHRPLKLGQKFPGEAVMFWR
jgi:hypothetical protein